MSRRVRNVWSAVGLLAVGCGAPTEQQAGSAVDAGMHGDPPPNGDISDAGASEPDASVPTADGGMPDSHDAGTIPVAVDRLLLDNQAFERLNFEIAPDGRWATLNERPRGTRALYPVLYEIAPTGALSRRCEYPGVSLRTNSSMQFGQARGAPFAVGLRADGAAFVVVRPDASADCAARIQQVPVRGLPDDVPLSELLNPYPVRGHPGRDWVAFHRHADALDLEAVYVQDVGGQQGARLAWTDQRPHRLRGFGTFAAVARWSAGEARFVAGRWIDGVIQAVQTEVTADGRTATRTLTTDPGTKADVFPFRAGGQAYLLTNDGGGPDGLLYAENDAGEFVVVLRIPFDAAQSSVQGRPSSALSFETFVWQGALYATYQVADADDRGPQCRGVNCTWNELWVASFRRSEDGRITGLRSRCRVSAAPTDPRFRAKVDPEPVVADDGLYIFHQRSDLTRSPGDPGNQLAVVEVRDRRAFDEACAAGNAAAVP